MSTVSLVSASVGDQVPGHELADPDCPHVPGLLDQPAVKSWLDAVGYGPDSEDALVYLVTEDDSGMIPAGFEHISVEV
ncbi:hypothetical protein [Streptomyces botrytidirepellens]|uniref:Uncharacterized protein n=1 Tax=Streptomyces botrytidirepellens TaxID=2486417 RepID=A0A3M8SZA3_9ACTN|nr:hypothetical protein [Streptomyces botrytidirepellens]RNF86758.1 hypothetical protein EEJ42_42895 [Streptomyces botrytidirepellens]